MWSSFSPDSERLACCSWLVTLWYFGQLSQDCGFLCGFHARPEREKTSKMAYPVDVSRVTRKRELRRISFWPALGVPCFFASPEFPQIQDVERAGLLLRLEVPRSEVSGNMDQNKPVSPFWALGCWAVGLLGWAVGLLGCWAVGLLGWAVGLTGCWAVGLGCWADGLFVCWAVGLLLGCFILSHTQLGPPEPVPSTPRRKSDPGPRPCAGEGARPGTEASDPRSPRADRAAFFGLGGYGGSKGNPGDTEPCPLHHFHDCWKEGGHI